MPGLLIQAHSAAMNFAFYTGEQFPEEYRGDAFVALKGSWNRSEPTGYKVVRVKFENGEPAGYYENFLTGFWVGGGRRKPRFGDARWMSPWRKMGRCWSPTIPAGRSGVLATRAKCSRKTAEFS